MLQPPVSDLTPWRPGHWITQTGYALDAQDVIASTKDLPLKRVQMLLASVTTDKIMEKVMRKWQD
jgi:hypothetical protein